MTAMKSTFGIPYTPHW